MKKQRHQQIATFLTDLGADALVIGNRTVVRAENRKPNTAPLEGWGDSARVGDRIRIHSSFGPDDTVEGVLKSWRPDGTTVAISVDRIGREPNVGYTFMLMSGPGWQRRIERIVQNP